MAKPQKEFYEYIVESPSKGSSLLQYAESPATAFLKSINEAKNASVACLKKFKQNKNGAYSIPAIRSIQIINAGLLATIMGNFETYQKYLFARVFEYTIYLTDFDLSQFFKTINKSNGGDIDIDLARFAAFRDNQTAVGLILADNLKNWQSAHCVNSYFRAFGLRDAHNHQIDIISADTRESLSVLWQMRHSIVHTASTISIPDAQKVPKLHGFGDKVIALEPQFISEVARKFHPIIKEITDNIGDLFKNNMRIDLSADIKHKINKLFLVDSTYKAWLK